ncbi:MAG TPA: MBL fold metallo-hydrolase [Pyrinomonadaceae bacterium]|nr:MBL fold metallo-hydrolase [Pyrinomonadaceae bacterium]
MPGAGMYLKHNIVAEPLFNQWHAWSYLIPPAPAAMFIANSHLKMMRSFVSAPDVHVAALKNPAMLGGAFINQPASKAPEIKELMNRTTDTCASLLELADAIKTLDTMVQGQANGSSLEPLYREIPAPLRGYVELFYDINNHPGVRFIEGLLYRSRFYQPDLQSIALFADSGERPFAFNTPKLHDEQTLHLRKPFASTELDELFKTKYKPRPFGEIKEILGVSDSDEPLLSSFFTTEPEPGGTRYDGTGVRIRYFGHACVLIESRKVNVLLDPVISYKANGGIERYTYADLPDKIDYALITHTHQDHCMVESLLQLRHKIRTVVVPRSNGGSLVDPSLKLMLHQIGFPDVRELDEFEAIEVDGGYILGLPFLGEHCDLNIRTKTAYLVKLENRSVLCVADSNNLEPQLYEHIHELAGDVDVVFIGMECDGAPLSWVYGPLLTKPLARKMDQSRRFDGSNCEKALNLVNSLKPKQVYVYAMGQEPWLTYLTNINYTDESRPIVESNNLVKDCLAQGRVSERLFGCKEILLDCTTAHC